jgi:ribonucleotide monophosphatase NagD (HAD superfamily)
MEKEQAGVFIDIDGVVLKGGKPFDFSKEAIHVKKNKENILN